MTDKILRHLHDAAIQSWREECDRLSAEGAHKDQILLDIKKLIIHDSNKTVTAHGKQQMMNQIYHWCSRQPASEEDINGSELE